LEELYNYLKRIQLLLGQTPRLEITSNEPGFRAEWNNKPKNTPYSEMEFSVKGRITSPVDNSITFYVEDPNGELEHRTIIAYDVSNPNDVYYPAKSNGAMTIFPLPSLQNRLDEIYATWHIATPSIVPGDIASEEGIGKLDGKRDMHDIQALGNSWLTQTYEGENFSWGDLNYDGIDNMIDFAIMANSN